MMKRLKGLYAAAFVALVGLIMGAQSAMADIVTIDNTKTGLEAVTFNPGEFVMPVIQALVAIIGAVAALWLVKIGVNQLKRMLGAGKA